MALEIGAVEIQGGTNYTVNAVRHALDCDVTTPSPATVDNCIDDDEVVSFQGNISTTCEVGWMASVSPGDTIPNVFDLTPDAALVLAPGETCVVEFDVQVESSSSDATPTLVEGASQVAGICDNEFGGVANGNATIEISEVSGCGVELDKQISCDGVNFIDVSGVDDTNPDDAASVISCDTIDGLPVAVRYVAENTGEIPLQNCEITESNSEFDADGSVKSAFSLAVGASDTTDDNDQMCSAGLEEGEPNTAQIACGCVVDEVVVDTATDTDSAGVNCLGCGVNVDKQVSCAGGDPVDTGFGDEAAGTCVSWNAFEETPAESVAVNFFAEDASEEGVSLTNCALFDSNTIVNTEVEGAIDLSASPIASFDGLCSPELAEAEGANRQNTGTVTCDCVLDSNAEIQLVGGAVGSDTAGFDCQTPGLMITQECADQTNETNDVAIQVTNTGDARLLNCQVSAEVFAGQEECGEPGTGSEVLISPDMFDLNVGDPAVDVAGMIQGLTADSCAKASVECNIDDGTGNPVIDPITDEPKVLMQMQTDVCSSGVGCLTHGPGFFQNHGSVVDEVLASAEGPIPVCGAELTAHDPDVVDALCVNGGTAKAHETSMRVLQLRRQCTATALNIAASDVGGGSCSSALAELGDVMDVFNTCCGEPGEGDEMCSGEHIQGCIDAVAAFNESDDTLEAFGPFVDPGPADPGACKDARDRNRGERGNGNGDSSGNRNANGKAKGEANGQN